MSENENNPQDRNYGPFVRFAVAMAFLVAMLVITGRSCRKDRQRNEESRQSEAKRQQEARQDEQERQQEARRLEEKRNPSFERAMAQFQELADNGCQVPFEDCSYPWEAKGKVLDAMDREKIAFGTRGVTQTKLDALEDTANARIASQKFAYLKANGGAKLPSDLKLLQDVCTQVYMRGHWLLDSTPPTDAELKQLLPPSVTKVNYCYWPGWDKD